jgi:Protein of unknown function (DUF3574)
LTGLGALYTKGNSYLDIAGGMVRRPIILAVVNLYLIVGCAAVPQAGCSFSEERSVNEMIYFGTAKPNGAVTPSEWEEFLCTSITPRFPKGLTYWLALGQWQGSGGIVVHEKTFVLSLVHPEDDQSENVVHTIVSEYKRRFNQEAVLRVKGYVCVGK